MQPRTLSPTLASFAFALASSLALAAPAIRAEEKASPPTHTVCKSPIRIDVTLSGVFESAAMAEVLLRPEEWSQLVVVEAAPHGKRVRKGEILVTLERREIDEAIANLELELEIAALSSAQAEEDVRFLEESLPIELESSEHTKAIAAEEFLRFIEKGKAFAEKEADYSLKNSRNYLEYELEELEQLEKMYKADDLTEETEEIIVKRQRDAVEQAKFGLERAEKTNRERREIDLPRLERTLKDAARRSTIAFEIARRKLPRDLKNKQLGLEKLQRERTRSQKRLATLKKDLESLTVRSPADGIVYYGRCVNGQWSGGPAAQEKLARGGRLQPNDVFMTVVDETKLFVRVSIAEKDLHDLRPGSEAVVEPTGYPGRKSNGRIESLSLVPMAGAFNARLALDGGASLEGLLPGMTASARFTPYKNPGALLVPASAVFTDEIDPDVRFVYKAVGVSPTTAERQVVRVGRSSGDSVEIIEGLKDGDAILAQKPEAPR